MKRIETKQQISEADGSEAVVIGTYEQFDAGKKQVQPPVLRGHALVRLADGTVVYLEPPHSKRSIRPEEERARCEGKRVAVTGKALSHMPSPSEPMAYLMGHVIISITNIELV